VFADASGKAYAAAIYLRGPNSEWTSLLLLVAKTKVASLKTMTIPRLELYRMHFWLYICFEVWQTDYISLRTHYVWSDASMILSWIRVHPSQWEPFVANRMATIQELVPAKRWHYVATIDNLADLAIRYLGQRAQQ